jgi:alkyl hydroperoxide reductase subunit D
MPLEQIAGLMPAYANDLRLNISSVFSQPELTLQQAWGTAVATAHALRNEALYRAVVSEAETHLTPEALEAAKTAAAVMGISNIYFRFQHLSGNEKYAKIPARLRLNASRTRGSSPLDFELWCTAVSAVNGCGSCIVAHQNKLLKKGVSAETILASIRIASVLHAVAAVLEAESALTAE